MFIYSHKPSQKYLLKIRIAAMKGKYVEYSHK